MVFCLPQAFTTGKKYIAGEMGRPAWNRHQAGRKSHGNSRRLPVRLEQLAVDFQMPLRDGNWVEVL